MGDEVVAAAATFFAEEEIGEEVVDDGFEGGEAGADDADAEFDRGPGCRADVVRGVVGRVGDGVEGVEADDGGDAAAVFLAS